MASRAREALRSRRFAGRRVGWRSVLAGVALLFVLPVILFLTYAAATIPRDGGMAAEPSPGAVIVAARDGQVFASRGIAKGEKLAAGDLPANLKSAIVAIEDRRFYSHNGVDLRSIGRALVRNAGGGREGASTITQQLARLTYLSQERSLRRKVQEAMLALWLDARLPKEEILARYLNSAYFGGGAYGADAASRRYFGKPAKELELAEAAMLAGLVRAPSALAPHRNLVGARERADTVVAAMVETGAIKPDEAEAARRNPASVWEPPQAPPGTGYYIDLVEAETRKIAAATGVDVTVAGTLDLRLQAVAERVVGRILAEEGRAKNVTQAALVAMAPDGAILAMVGGRSYPDSQFNRASQAKRQAGSLFKLFVYLAALESGAQTRSMMIDAPIQVGEWEPENHGGRYRGAVTLRAAFANSINTVAVQLADAVGIEKVIAMARALGVGSDLPKVPSLALGTAEVTLIEMVRAYSAIAAGTAPMEPYVMRSVGRGEQRLWERSPAARQPSIGPETRDAMLEMLIAVVREGTGKNARLPNVPVGGKTGTTQESRDAWFVGFTPGITIGVWVGNDDNSPTKNVTGGDLPAKIWRAIAAEAPRPGTKVDTASLGRNPSPAQRDALPVPPTDGRPSPSLPRQRLRGAAGVRDTATLELEGQEIRLAGIEGLGGRAARDLARYIRGRPVTCEQDQDAPQAYRCIVDGQDLAKLILFNGGARTTAEAPEDLREAEEQAREARVGVWAN